MMRRYKESRRNLIHKELEIFDDGSESGAVMERAEILKTLVNCGLSEYESKVYSSLVFMGTSKAGMISKESEVPQSKIYEVLDQLMSKQLVEVFEGRPKEFRAAEPENALKRLLEEKVKEIESVKSQVESMSGFLKESKKEEVGGGVWIVKGDRFKEFFNKTADMLERSEKYVYAITRDFSRSASFAESLNRCMKRGVKVRVVGMEKINQMNYYRALWYKDKGIEVRSFDAKVHPRVIVVDGKEVLLRLDYNPQKRNRFQFSSLWSEDASLVAVMDNYVKNMWKNAKPVDFGKIKVPI